MSVRSARMVRQADGHTERDTHTHNVKTITPYMSQMWGVKVIRYVCDALSGKRQSLHGERKQIPTW